MFSKPLFSQQDKENIQAAVRSAEEQTAGELVVVHATRSDNYAFRRASVALGVTIALAWEALLAFPDVLPVFILLGQLPVFYGVYGLFGWGPLLRLLVRKNVREERASERALQVFMEEGVTETRDRSGVLIFLSEAEHQVVILADKGINDRVEPAEWQQDVTSLVTAIREGRAGDGVQAAVARIGGILAEAFPIRADDENELSNAMREI